MGQIPRSTERISSYRSKTVIWISPQLNIVSRSSLKLHRVKNNNSSFTHSPRSSVYWNRNLPSESDLRQFCCKNCIAKRSETSWSSSKAHITLLQAPIIIIIIIHEFHRDASLEQNFRAVQDAIKGRQTDCEKDQQWCLGYTTGRSFDLSSDGKYQTSE